MASQALETYNTWVDGLSVGPAQKDLLKQRARQLYRAVAKETIAHLRHHANAVANDIGETQARRDLSQSVLTVTDAVIARGETDSWWLQVVEG